MRRDHRHQPRSRPGPAAPVAPALVPQHLGLGPRRSYLDHAPATAADHDGERAGGGRGQPRLSRPVPLQRRGHSGPAVLRQRDQRGRAVRCRGERQRLPQGRREPTDRARRRRRGEPVRRGDQGRGLVRVRRRSRRAVRHCQAEAGAGPAEHRHLRATVRRGAVRPQAGGRRVLRPGDPRLDAGSGPARRPPGLRRPALDQAGLPVRRRAVVADRSDPRPGAGPANRSGGPEHLVAARQPGRRALDAGRMGVPLVRRLGPGLPCDPDGARRPGLRQGTAVADVPRVGDAPERTAPGLRVGLRRREPPGPCLGRLARLPDRRLPGQGLPDPGVHQAAAQLQLVGEPQGRQRVERVRGRLPRDG